MEKELLGIVAAALGVAETEVEATLTADGGADTLQEQMRAKLKARFDDGFKASDKKLKKKVEDSLRAAGVEDASFDNLPDALEQVGAAAAEKAGSQGGTLSDEQLLRKPAVVQALNTLKQQQQAAIDAAVQKERDTLKGEREAFTKQQTETAVRAHAEKLIDTLNPVFSDDPKLAANQRKRLVQDILASGSYKVDGDTVQLVDADGNLATDEATGQVKQFDSLVRQVTTDYYKLPVSTDRQSTGHSQPPVGGGNDGPKHYKGEVPKTDAEYAAKLSDSTLSPEAKVELKELYRAQKG